MLKSLIWSILGSRRMLPVFSKHSYLLYLHKIAVKKRKNLISSKYFRSKTVNRGIFEGLIYPEFVASGSSLLPKLAGTYENEISSELSKLLKNKYSSIIDIGCAEGYYAVGIALMLKDTIVYAFDINDDARKRCYNMALINNVQDRIVIKERFSHDSITNLNIEGKSLIICDCEGCELDLFTHDFVSRYSNYDFVIETHDCFNPIIASTLKSIFNLTHDVNSYFSITDHLKRELYSINFGKEIPKKYLYDVFSEGREGKTEWLICRSRF